MKQIHAILARLFVLHLAFIFPLFAQQQVVQPPANPSAPVEFYGQLEAELAPDLKYLYGTGFKPPAEGAKFRLLRPLEAGDNVAVGTIYDNRNSSGERLALTLVEPKNANPYIYADLNADGTLDEIERLVLSPVKNSPEEFEGILKLPVKHDFYKTFPVYLVFRRKWRNPKEPSERVIFQSFTAFAYGAVKIGNKQVRVFYSFEPSAASISTTDGLFGIDADGDGAITYEPFSLETSYANNDEIVFRLGDLYLSTSRIDLGANKIVMRERKKEEYRRIELEAGKEMPDFSFTDFSDKKRTLKEFRGKYVLVDFWGLWCVDCRRELPFQMEAVRKFKARGFEILALDSDKPEKLTEVKAFLAKNRIEWTQARFDSIQELIEISYRIQEYPSAILLDPQGKVLVLDQKQLTGEHLLTTLDRLLPR